MYMHDVFYDLRSDFDWQVYFFQQVSRHLHQRFLRPSEKPVYAGR